MGETEWWRLTVNAFAILGAMYCAIWAVEKIGLAAKQMIRRLHDR